MIFDSKRALAKDVAQRENKALLAMHPKFEELLKTRKSVEISLVKAKNKGEDISQLQAQLEELNIQIKIYAEENQLVFMPKYSCPICKDEGYVAGEPCECLTKEYNALLREHCALAPLNGFSFDDNKFTSLTVAQAKGMSKLYSIMQNKVCNNFDDCKWQNFMLAGSSGVGKTCLATATANALLNSNVSVLYLSAFELVNVFLDKHTHKSTALSKMFDYVTACEMLIIDNFGEEPVYKNVTLEYLFSTVDKRMASGKKTFICTQLGLPHLISRYGETFLSKFTDKRYSLSVNIVGDNLRKI
ncbi:MAG: ATP-binding protein [Clostridia bacterium]|nr:ATP-binding protein [Clostridia bacterium]